MCFLMSFWLRKKVGPKSQLPETLADKLIPGAWFWRGRRERRCAGEERVMLLDFEDFSGEHSVKELARRSEGGGGLLAIANAADPMSGGFEARRL